MKLQLYMIKQLLCSQFHINCVHVCLQLNDQGHYAEALMTKGVLAPRGCMEQLKVSTKGRDLWNKHRVLAVSGAQNVLK